ncbi:RWP-RK domain [Dillenia turbinata]|uniref:RWP-RK domain n=1 Tax=Dillenia turbinata TaxID=194707 RepID=A0AAN8VVP6_9MAGN
MDSSLQLANVSKQELEWRPFDEQFTSFDHFFEFEHQQQFSQFPDLDIINFGELASELQLWDCNENKSLSSLYDVEPKPLNAVYPSNGPHGLGHVDHCESVGENSSHAKSETVHSEISWSSNDNVNNGVNHEEKRKLRLRSKCGRLDWDEIQKYFDVPISTAAKNLNVGLTVLKKRCRELNITRWPHRKIKSLKSLIHNVKELGLTQEVEMLEEHKRMMEKLPEMELTERTKKLRQACFKANYKKRRSRAFTGFA